MALSKLVVKSHEEVSVKVCSKRERHFLLTFLLKQTITDKKTKNKNKTSTAKYITKSATCRIIALY